MYIQICITCFTSRQSMYYIMFIYSYGLWCSVASRIISCLSWCAIYRKYMSRYNTMVMHIHPYTILLGNHVERHSVIACIIKYLFSPVIVVFFCTQLLSIPWWWTISIYWLEDFFWLMFLVTFMFTTGFFFWFIDFEWTFITCF